MTPPRRHRGLFTDLTEGIYWFLVIDVLLVLAAAPTVLLWSVLIPSGANPLLLALCALPLLPALAAALYAWQSWREDEERELVPTRRFLRGYRLNALDSLRAGGPYVLVLGLLGFNLAYSEAAGTGVLDAVFLVLAALALLLLARSVSIISTFSFRTLDVFRLSAYTLLARPLATLAMLSLMVLTAGIAVVIGEFLLAVTASLLTFALWASERPVARLISERFIREDPGPGADTAVPGPRPAGS